MDDSETFEGEKTLLEGGGDATDDPSAERSAEPSGRDRLEVEGQVVAGVQPPTGGPFVFAGFSFEPLTGRLSGHDRGTELRSQTAKALELLLLRSQRVVLREELRRWLWGDEVHVDHDQGINTCIREIRSALGDVATDPSFVETLPGRGYRFMVPVERVDPSGKAGRAERSHPETGLAHTGSGSHTLWSGADGSVGRRSVLGRALIGLSVVVVVGFSTAVILRQETLGGEDVPASNRAPIRALFLGLDNRTGEPLLDDSLEVALRIGLERHRGIRLATQEEVGLALARMNRPLDTVLDRELGLELAQRLNAGFVIQGTIFGLESRYLLAVEVLESTTGATVHAAKTQVADQQGLLRALDGLIEGIVDELVDRSGATRSWSPPPPLAQVTTANLEALKAYSVAEREIEAGRLSEARYSLLRATELDPEFAMAHARLGAVFRNSLDLERARFHFEQARRLKNRLTTYEAIYVEAWLATSKPDPVRAVELWTQMAQEFPDYPVGHYNRAMERYVSFGDYAGCVDGMSRVLELRQGGINERYAHLYRAACLQALNEDERSLADVRAVVESGDLDPLALEEALLRLLALGRADEVEERLRQRGPVQGGFWIRVSDYQLRAALALERHRPEEALALLGRAADLARTSGFDPWELTVLMNRTSLVWAEGVAPANRVRVLDDAWSRTEDLLFDRRLGDGSLQLRSLALLGAAFAREGRIDRARELRDRFETVRSEMGVGDLWQGYLDYLNSELALQVGRTSEAVRLLEQSVLQIPGPPYHARETLARAYRKLGDEEAAGEVYRWLADHRGRARAEALGSEISLDYFLNVGAYETAVKALGRSETR